MLSHSPMFQVAIYKFIAMHNMYMNRSSFMLDNGGNSVEALKAITEMPSSQIVHHTIPISRSMLANPRYIADDFDTFVLVYIIIVSAIRTMLGMGQGSCRPSRSMITSYAKPQPRSWMTKSLAKLQVTQ